MHIISPQHLAELLIGIARTQAAMVQATGNEARAVNGLQKLLIGHGEASLADLPARILLASLSRSGPDTAAIVADLERILGGTPGSPGRDLDFGASPP
jgi:hypothetical protein